MGKIDARTHEYLSDNRRFADVINYYIYDGKQVVKPDDLHEMDASEIVFPYSKGNNKSDVIQKYRDILKCACTMTDNKVNYLILGIENQSEIHYAMPVKNMLYDAEQYTKQVLSKAKKHRKNNIYNNMITSGEFLSGFYKDDKLVPVITIVVFWSADEWDGPKDLHSMMETDDTNILKYVPNYKINLISPYSINDFEFEKFNSSLAEVLKYIKYSNDKDALKNILENDKVYESIDRETAELIRDVPGSNLKFEKEKENINMCKATEDMEKEAAEKRAKEIAKALLDIGNNSYEEISRATKLQIEEIKSLAEKTAE
ncbi:MAG: Rpn family recombination-promoting nuclease/putative transposase [Lachnospiraceae bacterium]|nr:Rpn family recombination-promoting nuclease/putative transposase [Lachnospiraceae bacterium]